MVVGFVLPDAPSGIYDSGLPFDSLFGVPVHPLVVHAAAVLIPIAAIGLVFIATGIRRSKRYGGAISLIALFGFVAAFLATASGRDLAVAQGHGEELHFQLGEWIPYFALALLVLATGLWVLDKKPSQRGAPAKLFALLGLVAGVATTALVVWTVITGDQLAWG
jgi:uncharacterized membrane protein